MKKSFPKKGEAQKASPLLFTGITIEKLIVGGAGMGRLPDGRVVFVQNTCPGDVIDINVTQLKKNFAEGELTNITTKSHHRRKPLCPVAGKCGGCSWQHVERSEQLHQKEVILSDLLRKFLKDLYIKPAPIISSPSEYQYRNRIQPKMRNGQVSFFGKATHELIPTDECFIAEEPLSRLLKSLPSLVNKKDADFEVYLDQSEKVQWKILGQASDGVGFSQVNRFQNEQLIQHVLKQVEGKHFQQIYDLYAGSGNFTFPLAKQNPRSKITAVELSEKLVARGVQNQGKSQIQFVQSDVEKYLTKNRLSSGSLVVLDPPRAGCGVQTMKALSQQDVQLLIYISCHPASLARDLQVFLEAEESRRKGIKLLSVQPFEMFPQTDHFETIAVLGVDTNSSSVTF